MTTTEHEDKVIQEAISILERRGDERAKEIAEQSKCPTAPPRNIIYWGAYLEGALKTAHALLPYTLNKNGDAKIYKEAELTLIARDKRSIELFLEGWPVIRYRNHQKDKKGRLVKCEAALNILDEGLRIIGRSTPEFTLADYQTVDDRLGNEALKSSGRLKQEVNNEQTILFKF